MMKKVLLITGLVLAGAGLFAGGNKERGPKTIAVNGEYQFFNAGKTFWGTDVDHNIQGAGVNLTFTGRKTPAAKWMTVTDLSMNFGFAYEISAGGFKTNVDVASLKHFYLFNLVPSTQYVFVDNGKILFSLGPAFNLDLRWLGDSASDTFDFDIGVGLNMTFMLFMGKSFFLDLGVRGAYNFLGYTSNGSFGFRSEFTIVPKAGFGFKY